MMPIGGFDDGLHSQNEKMSRFDSSNCDSFLSISFDRMLQIKPLLVTFLLRLLDC